MPRGPYSRSRSRSPQSRRDNASSSRRQPEHKDNRERDERRSQSPTRHRDWGRSASPGRDRNRRRHSRSRSPSRRRQRSRSRSRSRSRDRREHRKRARSASSSSDSDDSRSRRKREKRKEKKRSGSKERKKKEKRERKEKKKRSSHTSHWGKYGIISDTDIFSKQAEFNTWLVEERKINPETVTKEQQKKEFSRFIEDYNTATLPHEKYYNIEAYDRRMNALRQGEYLPPTEDFYDFEADVKAAKGSHKKKAVEHESYLSREEIMELRKVQQERTELSKMKLLGMDIKSTFGVRMDANGFEE